MFDERPIGDLISNQVGGGTPSRQVPAYWNGSIPWASVKDFTNGDSVISSTQESITLQGLHASASNLIPAGTPMICTRMAVGRSAIAPMDVAINQDVKALQPSNGTSRDYLLRLLQFIGPQAEAIAVGSTVKGIRIQEFLSILAPIAPAEEQSYIAEILATIDITIRQTEALIEKLKLVKQGLLHDLLTRGIDANGELRPPQSQAPHLYKEAPLGWIPCHWECVQLGELADSSVIGPFGSNLVASDYRTGGVPVVFVRDVKAGRFIWKSNVFVSPAKAVTLSVHDVQPGDIIATKMGFPPCIAAVYPDSMPNGVITADIIRLRFNRDRVRSLWVACSINDNSVVKQVAQITAGVTRPKVTLRDVRNLVIRIPSLGEQDRILERVTSMDQRLEVENMLLDKLHLQKSGLLDDLLTGRVRVTPLLETVDE